MPKILVNYKYNKKTDTYSLVNSDVVFADMPIAVMEMGAEYDSILVVPIKNQNTVVDKEEYLKKHKLFKLIVTDKSGTIVEHPSGHPIYLPKDTDIKRLKFIDGKLVLLAEEPESETEESE